MSVLKNQNWKKDLSLLQNIEIREGQSEYAHKLKEVWIDGVKAYMDMKLRNKNAISQVKDALRKSIRYEVTEVSLMLFMRLLNYYPYRGLKKETEQIQKKVKEYQDLMNIETDLDFYVTDIDKEIISKLSDEKALTKLSEYVEIINPLLNEFNSLNFIIRAYGLKMRKARLEKNRSDILKYSGEAMTRLNRKRVEKEFELPHIAYILFQFPLIELHIENNEFDEAGKIIESLYKRINVKSVNWFAVHSYDILLNFKKLDFEKVRELLELVKRNKNSINRERNKIFGAYISLFTSYRYTLGKFNGELINHSKDKTGHKVSITIVQLLHLLKYKQYGKFIDRVEAEKKFIQRYLKSNSWRLIRSRAFLNCLLLAAHDRVNFNKAAWRRRTENYLIKIQSNPAHDSTLLEQEVVNFEYLYFFIESLLK